MGFIINQKQIFIDLYNAETEEGVVKVITKYEKEFTTNFEWLPYGGDENNYSIIDNQQGNSIASLIEKITNSIDAILMKKCHEAGIEPKSLASPRTIDKAIEKFFPNSKNWDLASNLAKQAEEIQIIAHGPKKNTSLVIYDNGEGQHPKDFESTLLSIGKGNKNEIMFVQGKYNMGGTGAIVFCGEKRYQLIGSRKYDKKGNFGFTLVRKHQLSTEEKGNRKNTWYEYLKISNEIPEFEMAEEIGLGLRNRKFSTGTIIKMYSYHLPSGVDTVISKDLNQSINEYLFSPALPIYTVDNKKRFPKDHTPYRPLYGLKNRLEQQEKYIYHKFSVGSEDNNIGKINITCYVFNFRIDGKSAKDTKETIRNEFFKNNMAVMFSLNGQVHGHYTQEFVSRSLKMNLLKEHVLVHVDCTNLDIDFRSELFMASRDRLKKGKQSEILREKVSVMLAKSQLKQIYSKFRNEIMSSSGSSDDLLRSLSKNIPLNPELAKLLKHTFNLDKYEKNKKGNESDKTNNRKKSSKMEEPFKPKKYPTFFNYDNEKLNNKGIPAIHISKNGHKNIVFSTDVEDDFFDRSVDPGKLTIGVLNYQSSKGKGGDHRTPNTIYDIFSIEKSSPDRGKIRINLKPSENTEVGDEIKIKIDLTALSENLSQVCLVKIKDNESKTPPKPKKEDDSEIQGLPELVKVWKEVPKGEDGKSWDANKFFDWDSDSVVNFVTEGEKLASISINMDCDLLKKNLHKGKSEVSINAIRENYMRSIYLHSIFLFVISKHNKFKFSIGDDEKELDYYLKKLFEGDYADFLLNFKMDDLLTATD